MMWVSYTIGGLPSSFPHTSCVPTAPQYSQDLIESLLLLPIQVSSVIDVIMCIRTNIRAYRIIMMSNNGAIIFISQLAPSHRLNSVYFPSWIIVYVRTYNICMNGATCTFILGMASWLSNTPIIDNDGIFLRLPNHFNVSIHTFTESSNFIPSHTKWCTHRTCIHVYI